MKKIISTSLICFNTLFGDIIGGEVNIGVYNHSPSGVVIKSRESIDVDRDLNWDDKNDILLRAYFEHPLPLLPNIRVGYTRLSHNGEGVILSVLAVNSSLDLDIFDIGLYYEILDNWINLDVGINLKYFTGNININSSSKKYLINIEDLAPTLYGKAKFDIPTTNLSFLLEGDYITYDENTYYDFELGARYEFLLGFGAEVGYKKMKGKIHNTSDITIDGIYGKIVWDF